MPNLDENKPVMPLFYCLGATIYPVLSLLLMPLSLVFIAGAIRSTLRGLCAATGPCEKMYWRMRLVAHSLFAYGVVLLGLLALDSFCGESRKLLEWWPSITRSWYRSRNHTVVILMEVLMALIGALGSICAARYFGYIDGKEGWRAPGWLMRKRCTDRIMIDDGTIPGCRSGKSAE